jgi:hypothetical protein
MERNDGQTGIERRGFLMAAAATTSAVAAGGDSAKDI